jgi:serine/threonine protein kinase
MSTDTDTPEPNRRRLARQRRHAAADLRRGILTTSTLGHPAYVTNLTGQAGTCPYEIVEQIGADGMAMVYRAYQPSMGRYVAIKVIAPQLVQDAQFRNHFQANS